MPRKRSQPKGNGPLRAGDPQFMRQVNDLKQMILAVHPETRFGPLTYIDTEGLWMVEAYTNAMDQLAVADLTSRREAELLVEEGVCIAMIPMPLALWTDDLAADH